MEPGEKSGFVVRNTFICQEDDEGGEEIGHNRSQSDPIGGRFKKTSPLVRISEKIPERPGAEDGGDDEVEEASKITSSGKARIDDEDDDEEELQKFTGGYGDEDDEDEDEDDSDDEPLQRAGGPNVASLYLPPAAGRGTGRPVALTSLLPEEQGASSATTGYAMGMSGNGAMQWPYMVQPGMYDQSWMYQSAFQANTADREESSSSDWQPPALGVGPPLGYSHFFHQETRNMGNISQDYRTFTKVGYEGRLSVVSESQVHGNGMQRYLVQFSNGELSRADGVGFVFSQRLPCAKNIQRIVSIFVNAQGRICMRIFADIIRASAFVDPLKCGDWVEMAIDLESRVATFNVWPPTQTGYPEMTGRPSSTAVFAYGNKLKARAGHHCPKCRRTWAANKQPKSGVCDKCPDNAKLEEGMMEAGGKMVNLTTGHLACVVKNVGVTIHLGS